ncbi:MAG: LptF/LptG family permease, partial [Deltaproteobacteria bacterium]|nr:LptF/LptG family permease [Deltaproteobacteria bacterium]
MRIINRYLLREFLWILGIILVSFELIYLTVDFIEKIDNFLAAGVPLSRALYFFLMSSPYILFNVAPVALLVSVFISFGLLVRQNEIAALKAAGVSIYRLSLPILGASVLIALFMFGLSETVIPYTSVKANDIWDVEVTKKQDTSSGRYENVWFKGEGIIYNFRIYDSRAHVLTGVSLYRVDKKFRLRERIEAREARWEEGRWVFFNGLVKTYKQNGQLMVEG